MTIIKRRHMLFGHVARLDATTPAHQILKQIIAVKSGYQPDAVWRRAPGRPRNSWIMQVGNGSPRSIRREWKNTVIMESRRNGLQLSSPHDDDDEYKFYKNVQRKGFNCEHRRKLETEIVAKESAPKRIIEDGRYAETA